MFFVWLFISVSFFILELLIPGLFFFLAFSIGAIAGLIAFLMGYGLEVQIISAGLVGLLAIIGLYQIAKKNLETSSKQYRTNIYALIGKEGIITKQCSDKFFGTMTLDGQAWACRSAHHAIIQEKSLVRVVAVKGAHLVVEPL